MRKKVLVVCMLNSVHSAKWLAQFKDSDLDFFLFPSNIFRQIHPNLSALIVSNSIASFSIKGSISVVGYLDYLQEKFLSKKFLHFSRKNRLHRLISLVKPNFVHALEFQHSAYLCSDVIGDFGKDFEFISTNWGSDIYHFMKLPEHNSKIRKVLNLTDKYSGECMRDVELATQLGFEGRFLPIFPNSGGFTTETILKKRSITSSRKLILIKGYGGYFGRVELVVDALRSIMYEFPEYSLFFYSLTEDVIDIVSDLKNSIGNEVNFSTVRKPLEYEELQKIFSHARVYVGCSISDGISTSFLEALVTGAYPVQTNTSCAGEWVTKGAMATLVDLSTTEISQAIRAALLDDELVNKAQSRNFDIAKAHLDTKVINELAQTFYSF